MNAIKAIVNDPNVYIESAGRQDRETIREAAADNGADTTLRVFFGLNGQPMPVRALGLYGSTLLLHEKYFPEADVQFVFPTHTAEALNGVDRNKSEKIAEQAQEAAHTLFSTSLRMDSPVAGHYSHLYDLVLPDEDLIEAVTEVIQGDDKLRDTFEESAKRRGADYTGFVAAHVLLQDTNPPLTRYPFTELGGDETEYEGHSRVISIGAQSERPFYLARMAVKNAEIIPEDEAVETGQLFTRHVIPPYLGIREGEPLLPLTGSDESMADTEFKVAASTTTEVPSVNRDLEYLAYLYDVFHTRAAARFFMTWDL